MQDRYVHFMHALNIHTVPDAVNTTAKSTMHTAMITTRKTTADAVCLKDAIIEFYCL